MAGKIPTYRLYGENPGDVADFWLHCESLPARSRLHNWEIAAHRHEAFFQIFLVTEGTGAMFADGEWISFDGPCVLFIPPGAVHGFRFRPDADGIVLTALADRLASLAAADRQIAGFAAFARVVPLVDEAGHRVAEAMRRIAAEAGSRAPGTGLLLDALATEAVISLVRAGLSTDAAPVDAERDAARLEQLEALVRAHCREHRPVAFYAEKVGVSTTHLNRIARSVAGRSVQQFIADRLMDQARRDLVFTPSPVQAIAYSLGFADPAYFNRFFRRHAGTTPGAFRASQRLKVLAA